MAKFCNIFNQTWCLLLMIHLLAASVCDDYLLKFIKKSTIEQVFELEKDTDKDSKTKNIELEDIDDEYFVSYLNISIHNNSIFIQKKLSKISFQYLQIALSQRISEILIPPPR